MQFLNDPGSVSALAQVVMIDLVLAGDNAVVIGLAAAGLPGAIRRKAILVGIVAAMALRIVLAFLTVQMLSIRGLLLVGGLLLLWVCWKMWQELQEGEGEYAVEGGPHEGGAGGGIGASDGRSKTFRQAFTQIMIADVSMSLDNVLAVAGAAREHVGALVFGLLLSVALMGCAATVIAKLLNRYRWLAYLGLLVILVVAGRMIWHGTEQLLGHVPMPGHV